MKRLIAILLAICTVFLSGCDFWMNGDYLYVSPVQGYQQGQENRVIEVSNYENLCEALEEVVSLAAADVKITLSYFDEEAANNQVASAVDYILNSSPIGSYSVEDINYTIATDRGISAVDISIRYRYDTEHIVSIKKAGTMQETEQLLYAALESFEPSLVVSVDAFEETDISALVQQYANTYPEIIMEIPQLDVTTFPNAGTKRLIAMQFSYENTQEQLKNLQEQVEIVFTSAELYVGKVSQSEQAYTRLYSFLMERDDYTIAPSITPAYSLLHGGRGDSHAFAVVYAAMCRRVNLDCKVITGTRGGQTWSWNLIPYQDRYYHLDLLMCEQNGDFAMKTDEEMENYGWNIFAL